MEKLPEYEQSRLKDLRDSGDQERLLRYVVSLRESGWTLQSIADPLGVSKSTIQYWEKKSPGSAQYRGELYSISHKAIESQGRRTDKRYIKVQDEDTELMQSLYSQVRNITRHTPRDSALHDQADQLNDLIKYHLDRMVPLKSISEILGITPRAVKSRLERHNERK